MTTEREALQQCVEALDELIELCAIGDVDESIEALGWGQAIIDAKAALTVARQALAEQQGEYPPLPRWSDEDATALAHRAGFSGTSWTMGPEELAHTLSLIAAPKGVQVPR